MAKAKQSIISARDLSKITQIVLKKALDYRMNQSRTKTQTVVATTKRRGAETRTTGTLGPTYKKIPKERKWSDKQFSRNGSILKHENGGVLTEGSTECLYIGHSIPANKALNSIFLSLVKELYKQAGVGIDNWDQTVELLPTLGAQEIRYEFLPNTAYASTVTTGTYTLAGTDTYRDVAEGLVNSITVANTAQQPVAFHQFQLVQKHTAGGDYQVRGTVRAKQFFLKIHTTSRLAVQNRTLAADSGDQSNDIQNNPLVGKLYNSNAWSTAFQPSVYDPTYDTNSFVANEDTGYISAKTSGTLPAQLRKPPNGYFWTGVKHAKKITVAPGQIISSKRDFHIKEINLNTLLNKFKNSLDNLGYYEVKCFNSSMFGLEKLLDSGRLLGTSISVGYEITSTIRMAGIYKKNVVSAPINVVGTVAITTS